MITRIVRMQFNENDVENFIRTFSNAENEIRNFEGCHSLLLMQDEKDKNCYSTVSVWKNNEALEIYRQSNLFKITWAATKKGFSNKPFAFTLQGDIRK